MKHLIPEQALDKHIAFLGSTGSGKTSSAKSTIIEPALKAGERVIIIDPTSAYWGLRLDEDGKRKGYNIYIFGGDHGDYQLSARNAELLAEAFSQSSDSAIFDVSNMTVSERSIFFTRFAETILRKNRGPLRFIIDEAHLFMPQAGARAGGEAPAMLHAGNNLVSLGRSKGFRIAMLSQRPAKLHKDSLSQAQTLVAMRLIAPQDRQAIKDWVDDQADNVKGREIIASLPSLKPGEGWVWAPLQGVLERVAFPMPTTFDSSRAPDMNEGAGPVLAPINLDALKGKLAVVETERKANDPAELKAKIRELEARPAGASREELNAAKKAGFDECKERTLRFDTEILTDLSSLREALQKLTDKVSAVTDDSTDNPSLTVHRMESRPVVAHTPIARAPQAEPSGNAGRAERKVLAALAQYPAGRTKSQIAILTGYAVNGGGFNNAISRCRSQGWIVGNGESSSITADGLSVLGDYTPLPTGRALAEHWLNQLGKAERAVLEVLLNHQGRALTKETVGQQAGYEPSGGGFNNALSRLRTLELIEGRGEIRANPELF